MLLGSIDFEDEHDYNAAILVSDGGEQMQVYHKMHLVPFGEYMPARKSFPLFAAVAGSWVPGDFTPGRDYTVFRLTNSEVQVAPLICFEDTVGELTRQLQFVVRNADLLVDVTNDGWFLQSAGSQQHLAECDLSLRRKSAADGARGEYRRHLFHRPIRSSQSNSARRYWQHVYGRSSHRDH